jgi:hypothetical protein
MQGELLSSNHIAELTRRASGHSRRWLLFEDDVLRQSYNKQPFFVQHMLAEHPLFQLDELFALCRRLPSDSVRVRAASVPKDADFDLSLDRYNQGLSLDEAIGHFEDRQAYIAINNPEQDLAYRAAIEQLLGEINLHIEPIESRINWFSTYVFISARDSVTPYHMDREMNFLFQIRGSKTVRLWNPHDDDVMSPAQRDQLLSSLHEPRPPYRPELDGKAMVFELQPGLGVHHPYIAPHLVTTGRALSISLAITFRNARSDVWRDAHLLNHSLRRLGIRPAPVGGELQRDVRKARIQRVLRQARGVVTGTGA